MTNFSRNKLYLLICPLICCIGLITLLRSADYSIFAPESLISLFVLVVVGFLVGLVISLMGRKVEVISISILIFLLLVLLYRPFPNLPWLPFGDWGVPLVILLVTIGVVFLLGSNRLLYLTAIFATFFLSSFLVEPTAEHWKTTKPDIQNTRNVELPPYIHIVLDEHIGVEGILPGFDDGENLTRSLTRSYDQLGFRQFTRAYSRYKITKGSFSSFMNFSPKAAPGYKNRTGLKSNKLFESLSKRGYSIIVFQSSILDLCEKNEISTTVSSCYTYPFSPLLESLNNSTLPVKSKALVILNTIVKRTGLISLINKLSESSLGVAMGLPEWPIRVCLNCIASETVIANLDQSIEKLERGQAIFIHLLWPHAPYQSYQSDCSPDISLSFESGLFQNRYTRYIKQIGCSQEKVLALIRKIVAMESFEGGTIVVHGDHGSRVYRNQKTEFLPGSIKSMQAFSVFFAVFSDGYDSGVDRRPLPIDVLLRNLHLGVTKQEKLAGDNHVMYPQGWDEFHPFEYGELSSDWYGND